MFFIHVNCWCWTNKSPITETLVVFCTPGEYNIISTIIYIEIIPFERHVMIVLKTTNTIPLERDNWFDR